MKLLRLLRALLFASLFSTRADDPAPVGINARLMQMPSISATQITFVYAGDIWIAPREGGTAVRLSSPRGIETFPRFSPDGSATFTSRIRPSMGRTNCSNSSARSSPNRG